MPSIDIQTFCYREYSGEIEVRLDVPHEYPDGHIYGFLSMEQAKEMKEEIEKMLENEGGE